MECTVELLYSNSHSTTHSTWSTPWSSTVELRQRVNLAPTPCKRAARLHGVVEASEVGQEPIFSLRRLPARVQQPTGGKYGTVAIEARNNSNELICT